MPEVQINLTPGAVYLEWCDQCLITHAVAHLYDADRPDLPPLVKWADHGGSILRAIEDEASELGVDLYDE